MIKEEIITTFINYFNLDQKISNFIITILVFIIALQFIYSMKGAVKKWYKFLKIS